MKWELVWTRPGRKDLRTLDTAEARRILHALERYCQTGHGDIARIVNATPPRSRIRVGRHRVIVRFDDDLHQLHVVRIHRRDSAY